MTMIETSTTINKPVKEVFDFVANPTNQKLMSANITEVVFSGKVAVGAKYTVKSHFGTRDFASEHEIVALEPNKKYAVKTMAPPPASPVTNTYTFESEGSGTKVQLSMDAAVMPGTEGMVVPQLRASLDTALASIKKGLGG
ncbi:MAG TPA: SRPBCC family protein [Anaerolineales bacterium]|nr:SRPBCC family protein [Anaerolineales bacterium]